jgi:hypothetical protein
MYQKRYTKTPPPLVGLVLFLISFFGQLIPESRASAITFIDTNGTLSASVTFEQLGTNLKVTLVNTSTSDVLQPSDVLTAAFFTLAGDPTLTRVSAIIPSDSTVLFGGTDPGDVVGGEWAYKNHLSHAPYGADEGISSAGLGLFGPYDRFPGSNLQGPASPDGLQYGITSAGDNPATGNMSVTGGNALIKDAVVFTLSGLPANYVLTESSISRVCFQYDTQLCNNLAVPGQVIPEPGTMKLAAAGLLFAAMLSRSRKQR